MYSVKYQLYDGHGLARVPVTVKAEAGVPGLYCVGDVAYVAKLHLLGVFVFDETAARNEADCLHTNPQARALDDAILLRLVKEAESRSNTAREVSVHDRNIKPVGWTEN